MSNKSIRKTAFILISFVSLFTLTINAWGQVPTMQWGKCYGGPGFDGAYCSNQTKDGGFIICGYTTSNSGDITYYRGQGDGWVVKTDSVGNIQWQKTYGGSKYDELDCIIEDVNGGYVAVGFTYSNDSDLLINRGSCDGWILKIDDTGKIVWDTTLGSTIYDNFASIVNTNDSGYVLVGTAGTNNGDVPVGPAGANFWFLKFGKLGNLITSKTFGSSGSDLANKVIVMGNGKYLVGGYTDYFSGGLGGGDAMVACVNESGIVNWMHGYGGSLYDQCNSMAKMTNGKFLIGGYTQSTDGIVAGNHGMSDYWVYCIDSTGIFQWQKCFGSNTDDHLQDIKTTIDGGAILTGFSSSQTGEVTSTHSTAIFENFWTLKINDTGMIEWENAFGGGAQDTGFSVLQTLDSGYIMVGSTLSNNLDISGNHGAQDIWMAKLRKDPPLKITTEVADPSIIVYPTLTKALLHIELPKEWSGAEINFIDFAGRKRQLKISHNGSSFVADCSGFESGMYVLQIIHEKSVNTFKIICNP